MPKIAGNKFVIVGGASLVGSHLGEQLLEGGAKEVVLADNLSLGSTDNINYLLADPRCKFVRADMLRINELFDVMDDADGVFAVAGFLSAPMNANPWMGLDVNIRGLQNTLEAARYRSVRKVVFSSSIGVYGAGGAETKDENSPFHWEGLGPSTILYRSSKIMGEALGRMYAERYGVDFVALRYASIYGERQHTRAMNAYLVAAYERIRSGERPQIQGDGSAVQDYVHVADIARANLLAMESNASKVGVNIVSGVDTTVSEVVRLIALACGAEFNPEYQTAPGTAKQAATKVGYSRRRAGELMGWEPKIPLEEGIPRLVSWLDQKRSS